MEKKKPKMERYQKVLIRLGYVFEAISVFLLCLRIADVFDMGLGFVFVPMIIAIILDGVAKWKMSPKIYTVHIAVWAFLLGLAFADVLDKLI